MRLTNFVAPGWLILFLLAGILLPQGAWGRSADELVFQTGSFDTFHGTETLQTGLEYRTPGITTKTSGTRIGDVHGIAGGSMTGRLGGYVYAGGRFAMPIGKRLVVAPSFAAGAYVAGRGIDLGGPLEFRSGIETLFRLDDGGSAGLALYHYSNASIYDDNPGTEALVGVYSFPVGSLIGRDR